MIGLALGILAPDLAPPTATATRASAEEWAGMAEGRTEDEGTIPVGSICRPNGRKHKCPPRRKTLSSNNTLNYNHRWKIGQGYWAKYSKSRQNELVCCHVTVTVLN